MSDKTLKDWFYVVFFAVAGVGFTTWGMHTLFRVDAPPMLWDKLLHFACGAMMIVLGVMQLRLVPVLTKRAGSKLKQ